MKKIIAAILCTGLIAILLVGCNNNSKTTVKPIEFQETKAEQKSLVKWKKKTTEELLSDAMNGDPAALHLQGMCYLYGLNGFPINVEHANRYFAASASLGFAPAINQVRLMYLDDDQNLGHCLFLHMVYLNLMSAFGHTEFTLAYHDCRKELTSKMGMGVIKEIEKIASEKTIAIYETKNAVEASKDKEEAVLHLLISLGIVGEDSKFEGDYWYNIFDKEKNS